MNARSEDFLLCEIHIKLHMASGPVMCVCVCLCVDCTVYYLPRETLNKTALTLSHTLHTHCQ